MKRISIVAATCFALMLAASVRAAELGIGDPAPKLAQGRYVQGEPVKEFEKGKVYVIEMWATWCGPCIAAIPHVNELQKKYADKGLIVIGQNVFEEEEDKVEPFVKKQGEKMTYRVAMDDKSDGGNGKMVQTWMTAAGQQGIPCSFIVNQEGRIVWIGHPMAMEKPLEDVLAGKHDLAAAKAEFQRQQAAQKTSQELNVLMNAGKWDEVASRLEEMEKSDPKLAQEFASMRFRALIHTKQTDKVNAMADAALKKVKEEPMTAMMLAGSAVQARDYDLAMKLSDAATEHAGENVFRVHWIQASVHAAKEDWARAIESQKKALEKAPEQARQFLGQQLKQYEEKLAPQKAE